MSCPICETAMNCEVHDRPRIRVGRIERIVATFPVQNGVGYTLRIVENAEAIGVPEYVLRNDFDSAVVESDNLGTCIRTALRDNGFGDWSVREVVS